MTTTALNLNITEDQFAQAGQALIPADNYEVSIYAIDIDTVKAGNNKGKPRLKFQFKIAEGEQRGRKIFHDVNAFTVEKNGQVFPPFELLDIAKAIGLSLADVNAFNKGDWLGRNLQLTVNHEEKMTKESGYKEPFNPKEYRAVAKRFRSLDSAAVSASANAGGSKKSKYSL